MLPKVCSRFLEDFVGAPELPPTNASFAANANKIGTHEGRAFITMGWVVVEAL
jgi:hypothetical protein